MWECMECYYNEFVMGDVKFMKIHYKWIGKCEIHANSLKCICNGKMWRFMKTHYNAFVMGKIWRFMEIQCKWICDLKREDLWKFKCKWVCNEKCEYSLKLSGMHL